MTVQDGQHHHRIIGDEVKHAVFENRQVHTANVGKSNRIQSGIDWKIDKTFVGFGKKAIIQAGLLAGIPFCSVSKVSFNERMKDEWQHFCESG